MRITRNLLLFSRILDELVQLRADFDGQKKDLEYFYRQNSQFSNQKQTRDIKNEIQKSMETTTKLTLAHLQNASGKQDSQFKGLWEKQQQDLQYLIKAEIKENLQERLEKESKISHELPWKFSDGYPEQVREQLEKLHHSHIEGVKKIQREMECYEKKSSTRKNECHSNNCGKTDSFSKPLSNMFKVSPKKRTAEAIQFSEMSRQMFSPGVRSSSWNNRIFFPRLQPSPVATVLPQRKQDQPEIQTSDEKAKRNGKIQKISVLPQRRSQRIRNSCGSTSQETSSEESQRQTDNQDTKSSVFDFSDSTCTPLSTCTSMSPRTITTRSYKEQFW